MKDEKQSSPIKDDKLSRRDFITSAAAATAAITIVPRHVLGGPSQTAPSDKLNVAMLGCGAQGQVLLNACLKIPDILSFRAVCDIWTDYNQKRVHRLLKKYGHQNNRYEDYREMLSKEKDLDAVLVATPDFWHADHAIAALEAGINVYLEKEMSNTLEGARRIVNAVKRTGKLLQVGHQRRSNPYSVHAYSKVIENKLLGQITTVNGQWNRGVQPDLGWPKKYAIPPATLRKYGFKNMHQYRNWRWYKGLGGGPIVDLGSHQIDIYSWFLQAMPSTVMASGGIDYYDKATHEWYDSVLATYEFETEQGTVRAFYQTITTNSNQGYYESFMGDQGALVISESAGKAGIYREPSAPQWDRYVELGYLTAPVAQAPKSTGAVLDVRATVPPPKYAFPVQFNDPYHKPHLQNFFNAIRGMEDLNCPVEVGYETAVAVLKVNEAVEAGRKLRFEVGDFHA